MDIQQGYAEVNGTRLRYEVAGNGKPIVFIHGHGVDIRMWDDQFDVFAQGYRVIRYDLRGWGKSALPTSEPYAHTDDLIALMKFLDVERAAIVGGYMGGGIAVDFAIEYPDAVSALVAINPTLGGFGRAEDWRTFVESVRAKARTGDIRAAMDIWLDQPATKAIRAKPDIWAKFLDVCYDYSGWHWLNQDPKRNLEPPAIERLHEIEAPTLLIVGTLDDPQYIEMADIVSGQIPNVSKVEIHGAGHMSNLETPDEFNDAVLGFLRELDSIR